MKNVGFSMSLCMLHKHLLPELWVCSVLLGENQDSLGLLMMIVYSQFTPRGQVLGWNGVKRTIWQHNGELLWIRKQPLPHISRVLFLKSSYQLWSVCFEIIWLYAGCVAFPVFMKLFMKTMFIIVFNHDFPCDSTGFFLLSSKRQHLFDKQNK